MTATLRRGAVVLAACVTLTLAATPADAAHRYSNGCAKGSTIGSLQLVYLHSIALPNGNRVCRYQAYRRVMFIGWWPTGTVQQWART